MEIKSLLIIIITGSFAIFSSSAQTVPGNYSVKGIVIDSATQKSINFTTVSLKNAANEAVKSVLTKSDGSFSFENLVAGIYTVTLINLGYGTKTVPVDLIGNSKQTVDLGRIFISPQINELTAVSIIADKPLIKQEVDRIGYDIQADPESKSLNVLDMMRKVPMLSLDADDNIKLNGNSSYKILINGKPSSMIARSPKDVLRAMPASSIQKIEVITTPPAKYDSEGLAGIINIITNKKIDNGYNGSINIYDRFPVGGPGVNGSFTVKQGKFGSTGYGVISNYNSPETSGFSTRTTTGSNPSSLTQNSTNKYDQTYVYLSTELSFEIDTLNLLTAEVGYNTGEWSPLSSQISLLKDQQKDVGYSLSNSGKYNWNGLDLTLNYQLGFKGKKDRLLTFSYKASPSVNNQFNQLVVSNRVNYTTPDYQQTNEGQTNSQTIQVDYFHPVKKLTIEAGLKAIIRDNNSDFEYRSLNSSTGVYDPDPSRSNKYDNRQNVLGAYNSYQYNLKNWGFKAGLRIEETIIHADFISSASKVDQNYFNIVPSISINWKFKDMNSVNFGYTQRIERPNIWNLNPFVDRSNPNFESTGNPDLRPAVSNNIRFGYSKFKKGSINIGLSYSFANNTVQQVSVYDPVTNITLTTYDNIGKNRSLGTNFNINYPITKKWDFSLSGNLNYLWIQGVINGNLAKNDGLQGYFYGSTGYKFEKGWRANASFSYGSPYITLQGQSNSNIYSSFSTGKEIIKDKLTFSASTSNPFAKFRSYTRETTGANFIQSSNNQSYYRTYNVSLNYRFGKLKNDIKKNKRGINNDDVSGGRSGGAQ